MHISPFLHSHSLHSGFLYFCILHYHFCIVDHACTKRAVSRRGSLVACVRREFFSATAFDRLNVVQAVMQATGKPVLSQRGGTTVVASLFGLDPEAEIAAIEAAERAKADQEMDDIGVADKLKEIAGDVQQPSENEASKINLSTDDMNAVVTVNEYRHLAGLGPLRLPNGLDDPDGGLTVTEFSAKRAITAEAEAKAEINTDAIEPLTELSFP